MKWNCDSCGKEFDIKVTGPTAIAIAWCEKCGEEIMKSCPQVKEYMEQLDKDDEDVQADTE